MAGLISSILRKDQEVRMDFPAGHLIFQQGEQGGDIFFIEEGVVQIFIERDGNTVVIGEMTQGEILGLMTFLNAERRLASARAKTIVKLRKVPHSQISRYVSNVPKWFEIVLKEFSIRIAQMNRKYLDAMIEMKRLRESKIDNLFIAKQIAASMGVIGAGIKVTVDNIDYVILDEIKSKLVDALTFPKEKIERIIALFCESGMMVIEAERDRNRKAIRLDAVQKLVLFNKFVHDSKRGPIRKIVKAGLTNKELRVMMAMVRMVAKREGVNPLQNQKVAFADLEKNMQKEMNMLFHPTALDRPAKLGIILVEGEDSDRTVSFQPAELGRMLACIDALKKLTVEKEVEDVLNVTEAA